MSRMANKRLSMVLRLIPSNLYPPYDEVDDGIAPSRLGRAQPSTGAHECAKPTPSHPTSHTLCLIDGIDTGRGEIEFRWF